MKLAINGITSTDLGLSSTTNGSSNCTFTYPYKPYDISTPFDWDEWFKPITGTTTSTFYWRGFDHFLINFKDGKGVLELDIPGVKKDKLDLTLELDGVRIKYNRKGTDYDYKYYWTKNIEVDPETAEAGLEDGVLTIVLKEVPPKTRKISIR